ncbi:MAG: hypothetical protein ACYDGM_13260 [Vulcanimicrobiaceae bacterium]
MLMAVPETLGAVLAWLVFSVLIDRRNARREQVSPVSFSEIFVVLALSIVGTLVAPASERLAVGLALAGIGTAACGDVRHRYLWEEISVPTLFAVLGANVYSGLAQSATVGMVLLGAVALAIYFGGQLANKEPGFGDVIPTAVIGAALGPLPALGAFGAACAAFAIVTLIRGRFIGVALPFGPAIATAVLIGAAGSSWLLSGGVH